MSRAGIGTTWWRLGWFDMTQSDSESAARLREQRLQRYCREIARYLAAYPQASDTVAGISGWWLAEPPESVVQQDLEAALELLVRQGRLMRRTLCDGTVLYQGGTPETAGGGSG